MAIPMINRHRVVDYNGKPMTIQGIRDLERAELARKTELARLAADKRRELDAAEIRAAQAVAEKAELELAQVRAVVDEKQATVAKVEDVKARRERERERTKRNRRWNVAAVVVLCIIIEYGGQWLFFSDFLPDKFRALLYIAPLVVPTFSWGYGLDAFFRAKDKAPYLKSMMVMWISAIAATVMIAVDLTIEFKNPGWAVFMGGASILGPFIFHLHVGSAADDAHEISALDRAKLIARKWGNRFRHPIVWWGAVDLYHASMGAIAFEKAWLMVYRQKKGHLPGELATRPTDVNIQRLGRVRRTFVRVVLGVRTIAGATATVVTVGSGSGNMLPADVAAGRHAAEAAATSQHVADEQQHVADAEVVAAELTLPMDAVTTEVELYLGRHGVNLTEVLPVVARDARNMLPAEQNPSSSDVATQRATSRRPQHVASDVAARAGDVAGTVGNKPGNIGGNMLPNAEGLDVAEAGNVRPMWRRNKRRREVAGQGYGAGAALVREYYALQRADGAEASAKVITWQAAQEYVAQESKGRVSITRQGASRVIKECIENERADAKVGDAERREA